MEALYTLNSKPVVSLNLDLKRTVAKGEDWILPNTTEAWALFWLALGTSELLDAVVSYQKKVLRV